MATAPDIAAMQAALREEGADGWLFYDFRRTNPVAHRILALSPHQFFTRRWFYFVPVQGVPIALVSAVESHVLAALPGETRVYRTWQEYREFLQEILSGASHVAMEYVPENAVPYASYVDAGTVEFVRELGPEVVTSANMAQRFEAVLTPKQIRSHRAAGKALLRARDSLLDWLRERLPEDATLNEYKVQQEFSRLMVAEGLVIVDGEDPLVAVNRNAALPHYSPTAKRSSRVKRNDLLLLDFSSPLAGEEMIFADYTWMVYLGQRVPKRAATLFDIIQRARDTGIELLRQRFESGTPVQGYEVDDAVRAVVTEAGYGEYFIHRTGHNIGTRVHGYGAHLDDLETHDTRVLLPNTLTSVEPGIYIPEENIGLRTEVDVLLLPGGIEVTGVPAQEKILTLLA